MAKKILCIRYAGRTLPLKPRPLGRSPEQDAYLRAVWAENSSEPTQEKPKPQEQDKAG